MIANEVKKTWAEGGTTIGLWMSTPDVAAAEQLATVGYDYLCLDLQHGLLDYSAVPSMLQAMRTTSVPLARAPWNEPGIIGKLLDAGTMGVIIPMVNSPEEAEAAVRACRYAPQGSRSWGPARAASALGGGYHADANSQIACIPMIETRQAVEQLDQILDVEGIDAVYVGPADLSISYGLPPATDHPDSAVYQEALSKIVELSNARSIVPGIHSTPAMTAKRVEQGFRMVTATSNLLAQLAGARSALAQVRGEDGDESGASMY